MATRAALQRADNAGVRSSQGSLAKTPAVAQRFAPLTQNLLQRKASCACGGSCPRCQAKSTLTLSQPNDPAEREADAIANRVLQMSVPEALPLMHPGNASDTIHRQCDAYEAEDEMSVQRKPLPLRNDAVPGTADHVRSAISSGGRPLDSHTRSVFEPRFGYDLSGVRIHTDSLAEQSAIAIDARAYTFGHNVIFGKGEYRPESETGKQLLAHELAHVVQRGHDGHQQLRRKPTTSENVWGFIVTRSLCGCLQRVRDGIDWANTAGATYAACDVPANTTATAVEACFDAAIPGTSVVGSTSSSGTMPLPLPSADPCQRIEDRATFVHETMHSRHTDAIARARGTAFFREWRRLAGDSDRLNTLRATFPAEVAAFEAQWNDGHDWAQDEVNSYRWERRFLEDVRRALNRLCS